MTKNNNNENVLFHTISYNYYDDTSLEDKVNKFLKDKILISSNTVVRGGDIYTYIFYKHKKK